jgi:type III secretion protein D
VSKRLRVLTGRHAGASQDLSIGTHTVGRTDDSQLFISDWSTEQAGLTLEVVAHEGVPSLVWFARQDGCDPAAQRRHALLDFQPVRFGDIVVCAGPVSGPWPSDAAILKKMFGPSSMISAAASRHRGLLCGLVALAGVAVLFGLTMQTTAAEQSSKVESPETRVASIASQIKNLGIDGITVSAEGQTIVVAGMVSDEQQGKRLQTALRALERAGELSHRYTTVAQIEQMIQGSVGEADVNVSHRGQGVFAVEGRVRSLDALKQKTNQLANDMRSNIQRIDVLAVEQAAPDASKQVTAVFADDTDPYVRTSEGVKHLGLLPTAPATKPAQSEAAPADSGVPALTTPTAIGRATQE